MNERQQVENIRYGGYTTEPSDYENPDGDLATCMGLVNEDGALKPVLPPAALNHPQVAFSADGYKTWEDVGVTVVFVHKNGDWLHYIGHCTHGGKLYYCWLDYQASDGWEDTSDDDWMFFHHYDDFPNGREDVGFEGEAHQSVTAIGNMLIVSTDKHMHYFLYNRKTTYKGKIAYSFDEYLDLGTSIPEVGMEFALDGELYAQAYQNTGITVANASEGQQKQDTWKTIFTVRLTDEVAGDGTSEDYRLTFPDGTVLGKGRQYCFSFVNNVKNGGTRVYRLVGLKADGTEEEIGYPKLQTWKSPGCIFTMTGEYVGVSIRNIPGDVSGVNNNTYRIEEGLEGIATDKKIVNYTDENFTALMGIMNRFVNKHATEEDKFIYPFFVRYATRLYTGDYVNVSPPILMRPNTGYVPLVEWVDGTDPLTVNAYAYVASLAARGTGAIPDGWEDLVQGVDIFVSQPLYCYDQGASFDAAEMKFTYFTLGEDGKTDNWQGLIGSAYDSVSYMRANYAGTDICNGIFGKLTLGEGLQRGNVNATEGVKMFVRIAEKELDDDDLLSLSSFYRVASLDIAEFNDLVGNRELDVSNRLTGGFKLLGIEKGALSNLATRASLPDEPLANRTFAHGRLYAYNKRLHLYGGAYTLPAPVPLLRQSGAATGTSASDGCLYEENVLRVRLHTADGDKVVRTQVADDSLVRTLCDCPWFFYPDNRATELLITATKRESGNRQTVFIKLPLTAHPLLNGAYWYAGGLTGQDGFDNDGMQTLKVDDSVATSTSVYVSEVGNPFAFKSENVVAIDATGIIGLCTAAKAMSTGQFGQFPLYVFTDNGVWAMELTSTGVYKATQPITRDVCVNAESITQLDGEVLFATARGIMLLSGSSSQCLSDTLDAAKQFVLADIMTEAQATALLSLVNTGASQALTTATLAFVPFTEYVKGCRCVYDYIKQRIIVYNPAYGYAYVYSIKGKSWGMVQSNLASGLNSYPDALAMDKDGYLVDFDSTTNAAAGKEGEDITGVNGLVVTRPLRFGLPDTHKTVDTILQRGYFKTGHVQQVLYASNDLFNWKGVWSSTDERLRGFAGTPYKYFRVALVCKLDEAESVSGLTVRFEPRLTNRPR